MNKKNSNGKEEHLDEEIERIGKEITDVTKKHIGQIKDKFLDVKKGRKRSNAAKKAAETRKKNKLKMKRSVAAKKAVTTRKKNTATEINYDLQEKLEKRHMHEIELDDTQKEIDDLIEKNGHGLCSRDQLKLSGKQIDDWFEHSSKITQLTASNNYFFQKKLRDFIEKFFHIKRDDLDKDEDEILSLSAKRARIQLDIFELDQNRDELEKKLKKLNSSIPKTKTREQLVIETQFGLITETETQLKKALQNFFGNIPNWYNERISERTRAQYEQRNNRKPGFSNKIENQDLVIIEDFGLNDLQYIFGRDIDNQDLVEDVFGKSFKADELFSMLKLIKDCRNPLVHAPPEPVPTEKEELLRFDCNLINSCVTKYLNNQ